MEQISAGTEADPFKRAADLQKKRDELDADIARVLAGDLRLLDDTAIKDRFQVFQQLARELLSDFREVEHNCESRRTAFAAARRENPRSVRCL